MRTVDHLINLVVTSIHGAALAPGTVYRVGRPGLYLLVVTVTPNSHRMRQRITHSFYDILHHAPAHIWGWNPSKIMVAHMHSV